MDRSCPKRKKTKKILTDGDVKKYLNSDENDQTEKIVHMTRVPEEWEPGLIISLYHQGFTIGVHPDSKLPTDIVAYDESDFIRSIEEGEIPDQLVPLLNELNMLSDSKLVVTLTDYRGFPRPGTTQPYILDFPITTQHVLHRSTQSLVVELYDTLGERLTHEQLTLLENYLLTLNSPPLCLDTSEQVFEIKNSIHQNQNMFNEPGVRRLIAKFNKSDSIDVPSDIIKELSIIMQHGNKDNPAFLSSKDGSVDGKLRKLSISSDNPAPNFLSEIHELCTKRLNRAIAAPKVPQSPEQMTTQSEPSPRSSYSTPSLPLLKPAPFIANTKPVSSAGVVMTPMSPNVPTQTAVHSMSSPMAPGTPALVVHQQANIMSPKNVATVSRMPADPSKGVRGTYNPSYIVPAQQRPTQQVQRMAVPMLQISQPPQQAQPGMMQQQTPGIIRTPGGQIMHMAQQMRPVNNPGHMDQTMNKPLPNAGMLMPQQYPRSYQYPNVQPIPRSYVEPAQYIPVQQPRPTQVLQISLPPNMSPQTRPRQTGPAIAPNPGIPPQTPLLRVPYNQMQLGGLQQTPNMQNPNNMYNQYR